MINKWINQTKRIKKTMISIKMIKTLFYC